jgi:predicted membrane channel-forming protein YqfA (hemolysin III family)
MQVTQAIRLDAEESIGQNLRMPVLIVLVILLAVACVGSSFADWKKVPQVMDSLERLKVPIGMRPLLPMFKMAGALGIIIGLRVKPLGIVAAFGLVLYFIGAVLFHMRAKDPVKEEIPALALTAIAVIVFALRIAIK